MAYERILSLLHQDSTYVQCSDGMIEHMSSHHCYWLHRYGNRQYSLLPQLHLHRSTVVNQSLDMSLVLQKNNIDL